MRKALVLLIVFAVIGVAAFADGTAGPVATWAVGAYNGLGIVSTSSATMVQAYDYAWVGSGGYDLSFRYTSADGNAGLRTRLQMSPIIGMTTAITAGSASSQLVNIQGSQSAAVFDEMNVWGKLFGGLLTVRAGIGDDYTIATTVWNDWGNTDGVFGLYFDLTPIPGLDIGYFQPVPFAASAIAALVSPTGGQHSILGAAYTMKDVGSVMAGAVLSATQDAATGTAVYFGAKITAIPNLGLALEGRVNLYSATSPLMLVENVSYTMGALTVGSYIGENYDGTNFYWGAEPSVGYQVSTNLSVKVIANVYNAPSATSGLGALNWYAPFDAGVLNGGTAGTVNFGAGANVVWAASGVSVTLGDYYGAATSAGNVLYLNTDLSL